MSQHGPGTDGLPLFVEPAPEEVREIHERFEGSHSDYLNVCRDALVELARERPITTDDLYRLIERGRVPKPPETFPPNAFGGLFTDGRFKRVGLVRSKRDGANGNVLTQWRAA